MKSNYQHILCLLLLLSINEIQGQKYIMESEYPITMSMTPMIDKGRLIVEQKKDLELLTFSDEQYNLNMISHSINKMNYNVKFRIEDSVPLDKTMTWFRDISFIDLSWNYKLNNLNFSIIVSNFFNLKGSSLDLEPFIERRSLVVDEIYFNHEPTSFIQASIQYEF